MRMDGTRLLEHKKDRGINAVNCVDACERYVETWRKLHLFQREILSVCFFSWGKSTISNHGLVFCCMSVVLKVVPPI